MEEIQNVQECDPSGLRPQVSNKLRLFSLVLWVNCDAYCRKANRTFNGASQRKINSSNAAW